MRQQGDHRPRHDRQRGFIAGWPAYAVAVIVAASAVYSFSPRTYPPAPATAVHADDLLVTQIAHRGARWLSAGEQGRILVAAQPQGPWHEAKVAPQRGSNFNDVLFVNDSVALAVGHESWIVRSEDGGETWSEVLFDAERSEPLLALAGPYDGKLFAIGGFGQYLVSTDEGKTWERATHEALGDRHLNDLTRLGDGTLVIAGERGLLAFSCDLGATWSALPEIYAGSFFGVLALKDNGLLAYGMRGNAFVTQDRHTWVQAAVPGGISLFGGAIEDDGSIVLVGENETVLRSTDGGKTFAVAAGGERNRLIAVVPVQGEGWLVAGESGVKMRKPGKAS